MAGCHHVADAIHSTDKLECPVTIWGHVYLEMLTFLHKKLLNFFIFKLTYNLESIKVTILKYTI